jgi:AmmeMemoRadiSam system protein A
MMFSPAERRALLGLARRAIEASLRGEPMPEAADPDLPERRAGAFVTIHRQGVLRGCIGSFEVDDPVAAVVARCAVAAAREDPRFPPVTLAEAGLLDLEISVLGPLEPIEPADPGAIVIGRHGLLVEQGYRRGVLLPQVAVEWHWDRTAFLTQTCLKAGLPSDAWQRGAQMFRFEAAVFGERDQTS